MALIVLYLFPLFTFYNPPNSGHPNNLCYVQIALAYFFLGSSESNMSLFIYRVFPGTDEHSSRCTQRSAALLFSCTLKSSPRRTSTVSVARTVPADVLVKSSSVHLNFHSVLRNSRENEDEF